VAISLKAFSAADLVNDYSSPHFSKSMFWHFDAAKIVITAVAGSSAELFYSLS